MMDWVIIWAKQAVHAAENTTEFSNATVAATEIC